jgi:hypothetical protein
MHESGHLSDEGLDLFVEVLRKHLLRVLHWYFSKQWYHVITHWNVCFLKTDMEEFFEKKASIVLMWCSYCPANEQVRPSW